MTAYRRFAGPMPSVMPALIAMAQVAMAQPGIKPRVVGTSPANGAAGVSRYLGRISTTFDTAMNTSSCDMSTINWFIGSGSSSCTWSPDQRTMTYCRPDSDNNPLAYGSVVVAYLNPAGIQPWIRDADGDYLDSYSFQFTVEIPPGRGKIKVPADPAAGFSWPYYLYPPVTLKDPPVLMVEPNNTGTVSDGWSVHAAAASGLIDSKKFWADELGVPYLVPTFPRPASTSQAHGLQAVLPARGQRRPLGDGDRVAQYRSRRHDRKRAAAGVRRGRRQRPGVDLRRDTSGGQKGDHGRIAFRNPSEIAYLAYVSDSAFLAGYTRFNEPGNRVSLPLIAEEFMEGWFPKVESDGWTGLAFVNIDSAQADVTLAPHDEHGSRIAENVLRAVKPGEKVIGLIYQLFPGADLAAARYFHFVSDKSFIGYSVSRSDDGTKLDGLMALARYLRPNIPRIQ